MEDAGVILMEALIRGHNEIHKSVVSGHVGDGCKKPAVAQISLVYVKSIFSIADEFGAFNDFLQMRVELQLETIRNDNSFTFGRNHLILSFILAQSSPIWIPSGLN